MRVKRKNERFSRSREEKLLAHQQTVDLLLLVAPETQNKTFSSPTDYESKHQEFFVEALCPFVGSIDFSYTLQSRKVDHTFSLADLITFALENLSNKYRGVCVTSASILKQLARGLIKFDQEVLVQRNSEDDTGKNDDAENMDNNRWHILDSFRETLENYQEVMQDFIEDFK